MSKNVGNMLAISWLVRCPRTRSLTYMTAHNDPLNCKTLTVRHSTI